MSAVSRPSFSDIVFTFEGMDREEEREKPIALGKRTKYNSIFYVFIRVKDIEDVFLQHF